MDVAVETATLTCRYGRYKAVRDVTFSVRPVLELAAEEDSTVFVSSHDLDEVERLVDDIGFLNEGRLLLTEPLSELQRRFRTEGLVNGRRRTPSHGRPTANGATEETLPLDPISTTEPGRQPSDWSPDGRAIPAFAGGALWDVPLDGKESALPSSLPSGTTGTFEHS